MKTNDPWESELVCKWLLKKRRWRKDLRSWARNSLVKAKGERAKVAIGVSFHLKRSILSPGLSAFFRSCSPLLCLACAASPPHLQSEALCPLPSCRSPCTEPQSPPDPAGYSPVKCGSYVTPAKGLPVGPCYLLRKGPTPWFSTPGLPPLGPNRNFLSCFPSRSDTRSGLLLHGNTSCLLGTLPSPCIAPAVSLASLCRKALGT